jgi:hypothetical protein
VNGRGNFGLFDSVERRADGRSYTQGSVLKPRKDKDTLGRPVTEEKLKGLTPFQPGQSGNPGRQFQEQAVHGGDLRRLRHEGERPAAAAGRSRPDRDGEEPGLPRREGEGSGIHGDGGQVRGPGRNENAI